LVKNLNNYKNTIIKKIISTYRSKWCDFEQKYCRFSNISGHTALRFPVRDIESFEKHSFDFFLKDYWLLIRRPHKTEKALGKMT
jgi:hypothetical protein